MKPYVRVGEPLAERVLNILAENADDDREVAATGAALGALLDVHPATAARALTQLAATGAILVVRRGGRDGPTRYRVVREPDLALIRDVPTVAVG